MSAIVGVHEWAFLMHPKRVALHPVRDTRVGVAFQGSWLCDVLTDSFPSALREEAEVGRGPAAGCFSGEKP